MRCSRGAGQDPEDMEEETEAHGGQDHRKQKQRGEGSTTRKRNDARGGP